MEIWPINLRSIKKLKVNVISTFLVLLWEREGFSMTSWIKIGKLIKVRVSGCNMTSCSYKVWWYCINISLSNSQFCSSKNFSTASQWGPFPSKYDLEFDLPANYAWPLLCYVNFRPNNSIKRCLLGYLK